MFDCYKNQEICNKAFYNHNHVLLFHPNYYKIQKMCDKAANTINAINICPFVFNFVLDQYKVKGMCDKTVFEDPFMLKFCLDRYRTQEMCDKPVDAFLQH